MSTSTVTLSCTRCGSTKFQLPSSRELRDEDEITCNGCGGKIKAVTARKQAVEAAKKLITDQIARALKRR